MNEISATFKSFFKTRNIKSKIDQSDKVTSSQYSLTPSAIDKTIDNKEGDSVKKEKNKAYQPVLDIAGKLNDKEVKNIAITGPFGSGKSSVLLTLQKDFPQFKYLNISLATLDCIDENRKQNQEEAKNPTTNPTLSNGIGSSEDNDNKTETTKKLDEDKESLNRKIEYSILQQLIYKEKAEDIPQSRFKRIKHISNYDSYKLAIGFVVYIIACCILFEPKYLHIQTLYNLFSCNKNWKIVWDLMSFLYILVFSIYTISKIIVKTYNNRLNKLNLKDGEIEINESTSIFNKHLDEIIYFFEVTDYDVVIIEDLDRFDTHKIFLKLRELNHILNNSKAVSRDSNKIVFIYAIRDDMFKDTSRTKFFDYISTVIPVINPSNSRDMLLKSLQEQGVDNISDETCMDLGIYIDDMRILRNVVNEFIQYRQKLQDNLSPKKMLGMILYKNYHPDDFAKLHNQKGIIYSIISNRVKYHNSNVAEKDKKIKELNAERKVITNYHSKERIQELRTLYVMKYLETNNSIQFFRENGINYSFAKIIASDELFQKLENNAFKHYYNNWQAEQPLDIKFRDVENKVDSNYTYRDKINQLPNRVVEIDIEIQKTEQEKNELRTLPLYQILNKYSADDFFEDTKKNKLIAYLIKAGYIDESYYDYISYFYPGVMTPSDRDFILKIKIGLKQEYNYIIYKPKAVVNDIHESLFSRPEILNTYILDFIVENMNEYPLPYNNLKNSIKKLEAFDFLITYYIEGKSSELFFKDILTVWPEFFPKGIVKAKSPEFAEICFEILLQNFPKSKIADFTTKQFKNYISERFEFVFTKLDIVGIAENVKYLTETLGLKFQNLKFRNSILENTLMYSLKNDVTTQNNLTKDVFLFITEGHYYTLTSENIKTVLKYSNIVHDLDYNYASYSTILESKNNSLVKYISGNIEQCFNSIFPKTSINETENTNATILNNTEIAEGTKIDYLSRQINKINLSGIDTKNWEVAIKSNIIQPTWQNIEKFITNEGTEELSSTLIDFISRNSTELSQQKVERLILEATKNKLFVKLMGSDTLPFDCYKLIKNSFNLKFTKIDLSKIEQRRVEYLIESKFIEFNNYHFENITNNFPNLVPNYLIANKFNYISKISEYPISASTAISLLNSGQLILKEEISIIESLPNSIIFNNSKLSNQICTILNSANKVIGNWPFIIELINYATDLQQKLKLFVRECNESNYDEEIVRTGLTFLGGDYKKIALQKGHSRKFSDTTENRFLAEFLKKNRFISTKDIKDGIIKMNARNIS